ncbi:acyl-CoA carboxylase subunit epsilon [Glaciihabitans sp. UYNi722]|uniref:acyl-CoA carboxylase subunit epsilon n=1 Tax=Glaciihabitans sp. UYNi722 TaxID=3156344 RepID=UPI0033918C29
MTDERADAAAPVFAVTGGNPTPAELAAVTAVLGAVFEQLSDEGVRDDRTPSAWQRSQRPIRGNLTPGAGAWRGFSA